MLSGKPPIESGIYLDMPADVYHADPSLGSTDLRTLRRTPEDWWYTSDYNKNRDEMSIDSHDEDIVFNDDDDGQVVRRGDGKTIGTAVHDWVLYGQKFFESKWTKRPKHIKVMTETMARRVAPHGEKILSADDYERVIRASATIGANPYIKDGFKNGFAEVSVFWTYEFGDHVVPMKARFDYLKERAVVDLKSIRNYSGAPFIDACKIRIATARYDMQAAHYMSGRTAMALLAKHGKIYRNGGISDAERSWILSASSVTDVAFVIVFFSTANAPLTWGTVLSPRNPALETAAHHINDGIENYVACATKFGFDLPWLYHEPLSEFCADDVPYTLFR